MSGKTALTSQLVELLEKQGLTAVCHDDGKDTAYFNLNGTTELSRPSKVTIITELT